jgi:uncharacterized protein (TIGR02246 family)
MKFGVRGAVSLALLCAGSFLTASAAEPDPSYATDIRSSALRFTHAFATKNADAVAAEWTPDGTYVDDVGEVFVGRDAIRKLYESYFQATPQRQDIDLQIDSIKLTSPTVAVERGRSTLIDAKGQRLSEAPYVAIHNKVGNAWPISEFVEYPSKQIAASTPDLNWLLGTWKSTSGDKTITLSNKMSSSGRFILSEFSAPSGEKTGDLMVTGINPTNGNLDCWIFDTTGGVGKGKWSYGDGIWYLRSMRVEPDGKRIMLTHVLTPDGANSFDWRTTNRIVDGKVLPDTPPTHITKVSEAK